MDGAGDSVKEESETNSRPPPPVLLVDGHDMGDDGSGEMTLANRMDELSTDDMLMEGEYSSPSSERFEKIIGVIEEIVVGDEFQSLQNHYLSTYWTKFSETHRQMENRKSDEELGATAEDCSEEKHEHFKIFQNYSQEMAHLLETQLRKAFREEHFDFSQFVEEFGKRVDEGPENDSHHMLESEIFEMLFTLTDFVKFKELFMDYKEMMEGKTPNLATGITLKPFNPSSRH